MEIIARLREEREALVARIAQIDKMLKQHDEWGREAQRLLSLTGSGNAVSNLNHLASENASDVIQSSEVEQSQYRQAGNEKSLLHSPPSLAVAGRKTPMPEFEAAVIDVLRKSGQPMDRVAIYEALMARGIVIGSGNRDKDLNALSARVYRMAKESEGMIVGERGQGYRLITDEETVEPERLDDTASDEDDRDPLI